MDRIYRPFHNLLLAGIAALCYRLLVMSPDLPHQHPQYGNFVWPGVAVGLWLLFSQSETITRLFLRLRPLRRLLAGRASIEGDWPLVVVNAKTGTLIYYGFMRIGHKAGYIDITGDDWFPNGDHALPFTAIQTQYRDGVLHYWYEQGEGGQQRGYTYIHFFPSDAVAERYTGVFHDKAHPDVRFYGRKSKYGWFQKRAKSPVDRKLAAKAFCDEIMPNMPGMIKSSVNADW